MKKLLFICIFSAACTLSFAQLGTYYNGNVKIRQVPAIPILWGTGFGGTPTYKIDFSYSNNSIASTSSKLVFFKPFYAVLSGVVSTYPYTEYADSIVFKINSSVNQFKDSISFSLQSNVFNDNHDIYTTASLLVDSNYSNRFVKLAKDSLVQYYEGYANFAGPGLPVLVSPDTLSDNLKNWYRSFGGSKVDSTTDLIAINDSATVLIGNSRSINADLNTVTDTSSSFIIKYDKDGGLIWKIFLTGEKLDRVLYARSLPNGDILVLGEATSTTGIFNTNHGMKDLWLTRIAANGTILWQKIMGGSKDENAVGIKFSKSNDIYIAAHTFSNNGNITGLAAGDTLAHLWMIKADANGNIINQKVFKDSVDIYKYNAFEILDNGQLIVVASGKTFNSVSNEYIGNAYTVKLDSNFNLLDQTKLNFGYLYNTQINAIAKTKNDGYGLIGTAWASDFYKAYSPNVGEYSMHWGGKDVVFYAVGNGWNTGRIFYGGPWDDEGYDIKTINDTFYIAGKTSGVPITAYSQYQVIGYHMPPDGVRRTDGWVMKLQHFGGFPPTEDVVMQKTFGGSGSDEVVKIAINKDRSLLIAGNTDTYNNGDVYDSKGAADAFLVKYASPNIIKGQVYIDANNNNQFDIGEVLWSNGTVKSTKGTSSTVSNINQGLYLNSVDTGTFITKPVLPQGYYTISPNQDTIATFHNFLETKTIDFALHPIPNVKDLRISMFLVDQTRPGFKATYKIVAENAGTTTISAGNIKFIKDGRSKFDSASVIPNNITSDTIIWNYSNFKPAEIKEQYVYLTLLTPPALNINDKVECTGIINPVLADSTPLDNAVVVTSIAKGSFDPNEKSEIHSGKLSSGQMTSGAYMTYVIRFQNTGTDTAFKVTVRDTLDSKLDWNSLQMISASHAYTMSVKDGNKIEWKFDPIFLPDSNINEAASHGYVAFSIKAKSNITEGDIVKNTAAIYFDFNAPVVTNTVQTVLGNSSLSPVTIRSFTGVQNKETIALSWQTSLELNLKYFEVERSTDGIVFTKLEQVNAAGNSTGILNYSATDKLPVKGNNYYRLKIVDYNGAITYSNTIIVNISDALTVVISPNPASYKANIAISGQLKGMVVINLLNVSGITIKNLFSGNVNTNSFSIPSDVNSLSKGLYFVEVIQDTKKILVQKLVVQ